MTALKETDSRAAKVADILPAVRARATFEKARGASCEFAGRPLDYGISPAAEVSCKPGRERCCPPKRRGPSKGDRRLGRAVDTVIDEVVHVWLPHSTTIGAPCNRSRAGVFDADVNSPDCNHQAGPTIGRRWAQHREADALKRAALPDALTAPGSLVAKYPLEIVQVDHTQADVVLVSEYDRKVIGRPWLTIALWTSRPGAC